jgi:hypothetical protein
VADAIAARLARRLGPGALGAAVGGLAVVLLPDPEGPGRRRALEVALDGELAAIGPAVPWTEAGASLRRAAAAFRLAAQGRLDGQAAPGSAATAQTERTPPVAGGSAAGALDERASSGRGAGSPRGRLGQATRGGAATAQAGRTLPAAGGPAAGRRSTSPARVPPPSGGQTAPSPSGQAGAPSGGQSVSRLVVADQHLPALLLAAEPGLAADLVRSRLAPLDGLGAGARDRLAATLRAWLDRPGQVQAVAAALDVHPQTVRYRLKQLRELFGPRLEDPEARFELALALRAADAVRYT